MTKERLNLAGWLSITNALFAVPSVAMYLFLETDKGPGAKLAQALLTIVGLGLVVYVLSSFRRLLSSRFQFHEVDLYISLLIWINIAISILSLLALASDIFEEPMNVFSTISLMAQGIVLIMFATRLLRLPANLYGLLKPYACITIVGGICAIVIFLFWAAIIAGAVTDVILGIIFFRAAEQPQPEAEVIGGPIK
jgi:hypothetical protein